MAPETALIAYCACIVVASVAGGLVPVLLRLNHRRMQFGLSFVSGVMLGVAIFHMVPHALMARLGQAPRDGHAHGLLDPLMLAIAVGFLAMFFLQRFAHFHQHEAPEPACDDPMHGHDGHHHHHHGDAPVGRLTWAGAAVGMGVHSLLEGVALAASMAAVTEGDSGAALAGLGTFLVILLHKPFDAMTVATLCHAGGGSRGKVLAVNACFALLVPLGVLLFRTGVPALGGTDVAVPYALAFSAGTFLCIAAADLLPEVHFHRHDRIGLSLALLLGVGLALAVGRLEAAAHDAHAGHDHGAEVDPHAGHDHAGHDHAGHDHAGHNH